MAEPFLGEIRPVPFNFAPLGWAFCNGQLLPIAQNDALFQLIGTTYGGDGENTFALPDLRGRVPVGTGPGYVLGQFAGEEHVTLSVQEIPMHSHALVTTGAPATSSSPAGKAPATTFRNLYSHGDSGLVTMLPTGTGGGSQPHENRQPFLAISFIIALEGIFPSRN